MTKRERLARLAGLAVTLLPMAPAQATAQQAPTPPNTATAQHRPALELVRDHALPEARLELVGRGS